MDYIQNTEEVLFITFQSREDIVQFVATCQEYDDDIDIRQGKQYTDAKSVMGMLLCPLQEALEIVYKCYDDTNDYEEFRKAVLEKYAVDVRPGTGKE